MVEFTTTAAVVLWAPESAVDMKIGTDAEGVPDGDGAWEAPPITSPYHPDSIH